MLGALHGWLCSQLLLVLGQQASRWPACPPAPPAHRVSQLRWSSRLSFLYDLNTKGVSTRELLYVMKHTRLLMMPAR